MSIRAWSAVAVWWLAAACASSSPAPAESAAPAPPTTYVETVRARMAVARDAPSVWVRRNPSACGCPDFEVRLDGVWHRAVFANTDPEDEVMAAIDAAVADDPLKVWPIQTAIDTTLVTCGRGALVVSLAPTAFGADVSDPPTLRAVP